MASAAEQLAANLNFSSFAKAEDLKRRIWFTLAALVVYRLGTFIPIPGIDINRFSQVFNDSQNNVLGMVNLFSGGAVERMAIFALNIMPYISAAIIIQLMTSIVPRLKQLKKEGEQGRKTINQYTRYGTVILATMQGYGIALGMNANYAVTPGYFFIFSTTITLVGGTVFLMWLGEQITARGVGNGISLIIFAGIVATFPEAVRQALESSSKGELSVIALLGILAMAMAITAFIVFIERAQRRLLVQYPKRQVGNKMFQGDSSHLPLKLNTAGVIPPIFASSLLLLPLSVATFTAGTPDAGDTSTWQSVMGYINAYLGRGQPLYLFTYVALIIFFAFFYTAIVFDPKETADNLKKHGGFLPGIRPGDKTATYIDHVLTRITVVGAIYLALVCVFPEMLITYTNINFYLGGTALLIVVSVTMDTVSQVQSHLLAHQYGDLIKNQKLKGKRKRR